MSAFYRAFEDVFRGSRELISERLEQYLPLIEPYAKLETKPKAIDLGCGRGEWLELLERQGFDAIGVDVDDNMLAPGRDRNLEVYTGDAVAYLRDQPDDSAFVITAFHLVEHLPFDECRGLVLQAARVLSPGGLLILETPNPENIVVGATTFYFDPTHRQPLPKELLLFLVRECGFSAQAVGLQESSSLVNEMRPSLLDVLGGCSPDYAIIAQKPGAIEIPNDDFARRGLTFHELATKFERRMQELDFGAALSLQNEKIAELAPLDQRVRDLVDTDSALDQRVRELVDTDSALDQRVRELVDTDSALDQRVRELVDTASALDQQVREVVDTASAQAHNHVELKSMTELLKLDLSRMRSDVSSLSSQLLGVAASVEQLRREIKKLTREKSWLTKWIFREDDRPRRLARKILFHSDGRPRKSLRRFVLHRSGQPRSAFGAWMSSPEYLDRLSASRFPATGMAASFGATSWQSMPTDGSLSEAELDRLMETIRSELKQSE